MTPTQLHVSGVFPRGREVAGIRVDIAVSFGDTKVPLGHTRCALDPQGALLLTLYTRSNLTRVEPDPAQGRGDRAGVLRFPPARYQVEATLHMAAQLPGVRDDLMRAFGWGEAARILLGEGSIVFGGEGAALGLRAESLRQLEELVPALERAASQARPAVLGEVQLREFTGALDLGVPPRRYFVGQLRSYVALPDQDLLNTARAAATLLVEFDRLIQQRGLTGVHRELKSVEETRDSLQRLLPELKLRGDAVLGR
ncbi:MAG: hypothetical protein KDD82_13160 [Planctomycetes bacterium]|nr:hypothetical protein [Planctomycetota bacterium]